MVGVAEVRQLPIKRLDGGIGGSARGGGLGADDRMLAVRFVPYGYNFDTAIQSHNAGLQLCLGLVREPIPGSYGILSEFQTLVSHRNSDL